MDGVIKIDDKRYPKLLREIGREAPKQLYYKGNWDLDIFENCLAVVGSRRLTTYGRQVTEKLVSEIASAGVTIVSGFMYGGDAAAHKAAILAGGRTIAAMPCGIDLIHPEYQKDLYHEILDNGGLIISEYSGKFPPANWSYPRRNRIVAGLSKAVLIIEAGEQSGTLITANFARKFKRKVFAVPGPITSEASRGSLRLLKEGAGLVTEAEDILREYQLGEAKGMVKGKLRKIKGTIKGKLGEIRGMEEKIIEQLQNEPLEIDALARIFSMSMAEISTTLSLMQLKGLIKQEGNKYYVNQ